jgi:glycerophosphoryl diester phosphodiesterase
MPRASLAPPLVIGHRGFGCDQSACPENTVSAFAQALSAGIDGSETDVRITRDGVFVLYHNESIDGKLIGDMSLEQLHKVDPLIPKLSELLDLLPEYHPGAPRAFHQILELKDTKFEQIEYVCKLIQYLLDQGCLERIALFSSFCHASLSNCQKVFNELKVSHPPALAALFNMNDAPLPSDYIERCRELGVREIHCQGRMLNSKCVSVMKAAGLRVMAWYGRPIETQAELSGLLELCSVGLTSVCTNRPDILQSLLPERFAAATHKLASCAN